MIDYNQVLIANIMVQLNGNKSPLNENLIRHMVFNNLRVNIRQFKAKYGEIVVCVDSSHSWRKDYFPFYKAHRKKDRDASIYDWNLIFDTIYKIKDEMKEYIPYKIVEVNGAEADDIIATLAMEFHPTQEILILSSDKDFIQLQKYPNITQYSSILKRFVSSEDPNQYLQEHIIRGDRGDGIPNFLTSDNALVAGERQKSITTKKMQVWLSQKPEEFCTNDTLLRGYMRNKTLIDLECTPDPIKQKILDTYNTIKPAPRMKMMNYFIEKRMVNMMEVIDEF